MRVRDATVTPSLVGLDSPDSIGTFGNRERQYVVADAVSDGANPARDAFALDAAGESYAAKTARDVVPTGALWGLFDPSDSVGSDPLLFEVPKPLDAEAVVLRWPGGEHRLSEERVEKLSRPTTFEVTAFSAPESVANGEELTLELTVENAGESDGTFVAGLNRSGPDVAYAPVEAVLLDVVAGDAETWTHSYAPDSYASDPRRFWFQMDWRGGDERCEIELRPAES